MMKGIPWLILLDITAAAFQMGRAILSTFSQKNQWLFASMIEYQENCGRGVKHLSAYLEDGDLVVYQAGSWLVDGVEVGEGTDPYVMYARIDSIQLVWTHNCEHGVLRGFQIEMDESGRDAKLVDPLTELQFGPEQLIAKIPVHWDESDNFGKISCEPIRDNMWNTII